MVNQLEGNVVEYGWRRALVTIGIILATLLEIVDVTIVNVALPNIQGNFGASIDQATWIVTGYIIANVIVIPLTPWLQMRFGRRQYYLASIVIFTIASVMCGLSGNLEQLVLWRIIQGLGGGGLISTSQAILRETYPMTEQGKAAGFFAMGVIVGPTLGPLLGGLLTDNLSWRWAFFVNIPFGIAALVIVALLLRNPAKPRKDLKVDVVGLMLLVIGIGSLQYVLDQGQQKDWFNDPSIMVFTALAVLGLIAFALWELYGTKNPIVDLHILRYRSVAAGSVLGMVLGVSLYGTVLILPQYVQNSLGFTATLSGELITVRALAVMFCTPPIAALSQKGKIDTRIATGIGFFLVGISNLLLARVTTPQSEFWTFGLSLVVSGIGLSQIFVPLTLSVLSGVPASEVPKASAFFNLSRQLGGSIATAVLVTMLLRSNAAHQADLAANMRLAQAPVAQFVQRDGGAQSPKALNDLYRIVAQQSIVLAYADVARVTAMISIVLCPLVFLLRRSKSPVAAVPVD